MLGIEGWCGGSPLQHSQLPYPKSNKHDNEIISRVALLLNTNSMFEPLISQIGIPFITSSKSKDDRVQIRAELDAYFARLYGLNRDDLRYILDPADVMGEGYPSETFRVLKKNEEREFGEYRTQRLVLEAWDKLETGELR